MFCTRRAFLRSTCGAALAAAGVRAAAADPAPQLRIGMLASMFRDVKPAVMTALAKPFNAFVYNQTGLTNDLVLLPTPDELRAQLEAGKVQFGVFHSHEFAWMCAKQPALVPLMIASPARKPIQCFLVVPAASSVTAFADLRGKGLAIPTGTREYGRLFLERQCLALGLPSSQFFSITLSQPNQEAALHEVADNKRIQAALVELSGLEAFADRHPLRNKRLRVLTTSQPFPPAALVYCKGSIDEGTLCRFRDGMAAAHHTELGKQLLTLWKLAGFEPVPPDYLANVAALAKNYPAPPDDAK